MTTQIDHKFIITFENVPGIYMYLLKSMLHFFMDFLMGHGLIYMYDVMSPLKLML